MSTHSNLLFPAYAAQIHLRDKYFGRHVWHELTGRRKDLKGMGTLETLRKQFAKLNTAYQRKNMVSGVSVKCAHKTTKSKPAAPSNKEGENFYTIRSK